MAGVAPRQNGLLIMVGAGRQRWWAPRAEYEYAERLGWRLFHDALDHSRLLADRDRATRVFGHDHG